MLLLAYLSLAPLSYEERTGLGGKLEHVVAYAGTTALMLSAYPGVGYVPAAAAMAVYAAVLEGGQSLAPGRSPKLLDWIASCTGVLFGTAFGKAARRSLLGLGSKPALR